LCRLNSYINCLGNSNITIHSYIFLGIYAYKESYLIKGMHVWRPFKRPTTCLYSIATKQWEWSTIILEYKFVYWTIA